MEIDPIAPGDENGNSEETFDRSIWKDRQEMLQTFEISVRTLRRWTKKEGVRMRQFKKKHWYHIKDAEQLYQKKDKKTENPAKMPISIPWLGFWAAETLIIFLPIDSYVKALTMIVPLIIVLPADIIIRIRKRRKKKQLLQKNQTRKQRSRRNH